MTEFTHELESSFKSAFDTLLENKILSSGDTVVITAGMPIGVQGSTNLLYIHTVGGAAAGGPAL